MIHKPKIYFDGGQWRVKLKTSDELDYMDYMDFGLYIFFVDMAMFWCHRKTDRIRCRIKNDHVLRRLSETKEKIFAEIT